MRTSARRLFVAAWLAGCAAPTTPAASSSSAASTAGRGAVASAAKGGDGGSPWIVAGPTSASPSPGAAGAPARGPAGAPAPVAGRAAGSGATAPAAAAGSGAAARPTTGPCASPSDRTALRDGSANAQGWVCATGCALDPDAVGCITPCLESMLQLSNGCAACQAQAVACGLNGCTAECSVDPDGPECHACVMSSCTNIRC